MSKIEGTTVAASRLESGEQATCGVVLWTTEKQKAEMERWEYNGLVVVERKADHDAREAEVERLRDIERRRVAEGMSAWCSPESPHVAAIAAALEHAKAKHPKFADVSVSSLDNKTAADGLADFREFLSMVIGKGRSTGVDVLKCELWEAVEAFTRKDYAATMDELAQCGAVVVRMMEAVQALMDGQEQAAKAGEVELMTNAARLIREVIGRDLNRRRRFGMYQDQIDDLWKVVDMLAAAAKAGEEPIK